MNKRADISQLMEDEDAIESTADQVKDDLDLDLGAKMVSAADASETKAKTQNDEIPDMSVVSPYHISNYPLAFKKRFERLKKAGAVRGSHSAFVQEAVEGLLCELEDKYKDKI